ncbi:MAG: ABC1 kinase family protein [Reyranella sp.]
MPSWRRAVRVIRVLRRFGIDRAAVTALLRPDTRPADAAVIGAQLRAALESLGPTFIKFGQMLAQRPDLLPEPVVTELHRLEDAVAPFDGDRAQAILEQELGRSIGELFTHFDSVPVAAASIAQVHRATLRDGTVVAVKIQRPGLQSTIEADLALLALLGRLATRRLAAAAPLSLGDLIEEFGDSLRRELDFRIEARAAREIAEGLADDPGISVPPVLAELTTARVLTTRYSTGHKLRPDWPPDPATRRRVADTLARAFLRQILEIGVFHGDLHPGNLFLQSDGRLCLHDFGIVGRLDPGMREQLQGLLLALLARDAHWMSNIYLAMGVVPDDVDRAMFERDLAESVRRYFEEAKERTSIGEVLREFVRLSRHHRVRVPQGVLLVGKGFLQVESLAALLVPGYDLRQLLPDYAVGMITRQLRFQPDALAWGAQAYRGWLGLRHLATTGPSRLSGWIEQLAHGRIALQIQITHLDDAARRLDRAVGRLALALVTAAFLIAAAIVGTSHVEPHWHGVPWLAWSGYGIAVVLAAAWGLSAWRARR